MPIFMHGLPLMQAAVAYAKRTHDGQRRKVDGAPFIVHPLEVASLLYYAGASDHLIAAGALHDTIEKTEVIASDLRERFGSRVATLVLAVSEDETITGYARRKAALREQVASAGEEALMLFAADKLSKARELRLEPTPARESYSGGAAITRSRGRRLTHYRDCLALLQDQLPHSPLVEELRTELDAGGEGPLSEPVLSGYGRSGTSETAWQ
jgi:guanosine-3',5'-bis(diphosphate) 3'-pyrophosphohydrolase